MGKRGQQSGPMQGMEVSPEGRKRIAKRRKKQEARWARKSGSVQTRRLVDLSKEEKTRLGLADHSSHEVPSGDEALRLEQAAADAEANPSQRG